MKLPKNLQRCSGKKKIASSPLGVPLDDLLRVLQPTSIKASLDGDTLVAADTGGLLTRAVVDGRSIWTKNCRWVRDAGRG